MHFIVDGPILIAGLFCYPYRMPICIIILLLSAVIIYTIIKWTKERKRRIKAETNLAYMDLLFDDVRKLRHQYNNLFQTAVLYIENEQWNSMTELKKDILLTTSQQNRNSRLLLLKIKNHTVRNLLQELAERCSSYGIIPDIRISGEISYIPAKEADLSDILRFFMENILDEVAKSSKKELIITIGTFEQGTFFQFDSTFLAKLETGRTYMGEFAANDPKRKKKADRVNKILKRNKNMIYNNFVENGYYRQEIMITS